jgi:peptidyl-prolyl cis-trans isomerase SurA
MNKNTQIKIFSFFVLMSLLSFFLCEKANSEEMIDRIVAKVNESIITMNDLNKRLDKDNDYSKLYTESDKLAYKKMIIDSMIVEKLLLKKAEELDININEKLMNLQLMELYKAKSLDALKMNLKGLGLDYEEAKEWISNSLKIERLLSKEVYNKSQITELEVNDYSQQEIENIEVHARQILIKIPESSDENTIKKLKEKAQIVHNKLSHGDDFIQISSEYSDAQNKQEGGDLGYLRKGGLPENFEIVLFSLKKGEISDIIETDIGFHILQAIDIRKIEENPDKLKEKIKKEREDALKNEYIERLKKESIIKILL